MIMALDRPKSGRVSHGQCDSGLPGPYRRQTIGREKEKTKNDQKCVLKMAQRLYKKHGEWCCT